MVFVAKNEYLTQFWKEKWQLCPKLFRLYYSKVIMSPVIFLFAFFLTLFLQPKRMPILPFFEFWIFLNSRTDDQNDPSIVKQLKALGIDGVIYDRMDCNNGKEVKESVFLLDVKQLQQQQQSGSSSLCSCSPPSGSASPGTKCCHCQDISITNISNHVIEKFTTNLHSFLLLNYFNFL